MGGGRQQLVRVPPRQVFGQHHHCGHVQPPVSDDVEDEGEAACRPCRIDAPRNRPLAPVELLDAVRVHRRVALPEEELALLDFDETGEQERGRPAVAHVQGPELVEDGVVAEVGSGVGSMSETPGGGGDLQGTIQGDQPVPYAYEAETTIASSRHDLR